MSAHSPEAERLYQSMVGKNSTDIRAAQRDARRRPDAPAMVTKEEAEAAVAAARLEEKRDALADSLDLKGRVFTRGEFDAVVSGRKPVLHATEAVLAAVGRDAAEELLTALQESPEHNYEAAALSEALAVQAANAHLSLEQARAHAAAEDTRLAQEHDAARFVALQENSSPEVAARMAELDNTLAISGVDAPPLVVHGVAVVDTLAEQQAAQKERIMNAGLRGLRDELTRAPSYVADVDRQRESIVNHARVVPANPGVRQNVDRLRIMGGDAIDSGELDRVKSAAAHMARELFNQPTTERRTS